MPYVGREANSFTTVVDVTVSDDLTVTDDATIGGDLTVTGTTTVAAPVVSTGQNASHKTSSIVLSQESSTKSQIRAYGADASTAGQLEVVLSANDGNPSINNSVLFSGSETVFNDGSADVDFRVESNGNANMLFVDAGNDAVGIGNNNPADYGSLVDNLVIGTTSGNNGMTIASGTDSGGRIQFADNTASPFRGAFEYDHGADKFIFYTAGSARATITSGGDIDVETGDIFFSTAGKGIVLGATSNTDANTLHDYEEGTWTPRITASTAGVATPGSGNVGYYTKIGNLVKLSGFIQWTEITTALNGNRQISGLPFTVKNSTNNLSGTMMIRQFNGFSASSQHHAFSPNVNATTADVISFGGGSGSGQNYTHLASVSASGNVYDVHITYIAAD